MISKNKKQEIFENMDTSPTDVFKKKMSYDNLFKIRLCTVFITKKVTPSKQKSSNPIKLEVIRQRFGLKSRFVANVFQESNWRSWVRAIGPNFAVELRWSRLG